MFRRLTSFLFGSAPSPRASGGYKRFVDPSTGRLEYVHRRVAEKKMGGRIRKGYEVHHRDGDPSNNRPSNLVTLSKADHQAVHRLKRALDAERRKPFWSRSRQKIADLEDEIARLERRR